MGDIGGAKIQSRGLVTWVTKGRDESRGTQSITGRCLQQGPFAESVVDLKKMRRILSFFIALGLVGLGPLPLSACALIYSQPSECATPQTETHCDQMGMDQAERPSVSAASKTCCAISEAPLPEAQSNAGNLPATAGSALDSSATPEVVRLANTRLLDAHHDFSSPPLQPLLCTFLI